MTLFQTNELIYLRQLPNSHPYHDDPDRYTHLSPEVAILRSFYEEMTPWQKEKARTVAFARSSLKALLAGRSAAKIHGIAVLGRDLPVELIYPGDSQPSGKKHWPTGAVYRRGYVAADEITEVDGCRTVTVGRALRDVIVHHGELAGLVAVESALRQDLIYWAELNDKVLGTRRYPKKKLVAATLELASLQTQSVAETVARWVLLRWPIEGLKSFRMQVAISIPSGKAVVDFLLDDWIILEIDGEMKYAEGAYGRTAQRTENLERKREKELQNLGYPVIRAGWADLFGRHGQPPRLLNLVGDALARFPKPEGK